MINWSESFLMNSHENKVLVTEQELMALQIKKIQTATNTLKAVGTIFGYAAC